MRAILFLSIIIGFCSCAPATVSNQPYCSITAKVGEKYNTHSYTNNTYLNFSWPVEGEIVNRFGANINHISNKGINIKAKHTENVVASESGKVVFADYIKGWGKTLIIQHSCDFYTVYANLNETSVKEGISVKRGDAIGKLASAKGNSDAVLHFEIRKKHLAQNPMQYLKTN